MRGPDLAASRSHPRSELIPPMRYTGASRGCAPRCLRPPCVPRCTVYWTRLSAAVLRQLQLLRNGHGRDSVPDVLPCTHFVNAMMPHSRRCRERSVSTPLLERVLSFSRGEMYMRRLLYSGYPGWLRKPIPSCTPLIVPYIVPSRSYSSHGLRRVRCSPSPHVQAGKRYSPLCSMSADPVFPRRRKVMPGSSRRRRTFTRASAYVSTTANSACFRMRIPTSSLSRPR